MKFFKQIIIIAIVFMMSSCVKYTPEQYFSRAVLNMNSVRDMGCRQLNHWLANDPVIYDDSNNKQTATYEEYVKWRAVATCQQTLNRIKELPETEETKPMLDASKALFTRALELYETEIPKLAALKDKGASQEEMDAACAEFDEKFGVEFGVLYQNLFELGMKYAKDNNLNVSTF